MNNVGFLDKNDDITRGDLTPIVTLFYSNYSGNSKALLQYIKNLRSNISIKYINIDNEVIKKIILQKISIVPAIVVLLGDEISLYTGENAFEWFNMIDSSKEYNDYTLLKSNKKNIHAPEDLKKINDTIQGVNKESKKTIGEIAADISKEREKMG